MQIHIRFWPLIAATLAVLFILWLPYYFFMTGPVVSSVDTLGGIEPVRFTVSKGEGLRDISTALSQQNLIRSASFFRLHAFLSGKAHQLKPGVYLMSSASTTQELASQLVSGPPDEVEVLIVEGETVREIDAQLAQAGVITAGDILRLKPAAFASEFPFLAKAKTFEGFLFPDTYRFYYASKPETIIGTMLANFDRKVRLKIENSRKSFSEILTIASMIEREVPDRTERRVVSGIMYKRLSIDMPLQIDATVSYALLNGDRYNTYTWYGLPPGPIANPGLDAIDAAIFPKASKYLYYLSDPKTDKTIFSRTFEEHKANIAKYLP